MAMKWFRCFVVIVSYLLFIFVIIPLYYTPVILNIISILTVVDYFADKV